MIDQVFIQISLPIGYGQLPTGEQKLKALQRAHDLRLDLEKVGFTVLNPFEFPCRQDWTYQHYLQICMHMMFAFRPVMFFDSGWNESSGCRKEMRYAAQLELDIRLNQPETWRNFHNDFEMLKAKKSMFKTHNTLILTP